MLRVSHSKIKAWRRCRFAYSQKYIHNLVPRRKKRALLMGGYIHDGIEAITKGENWEAVVDRCCEEYDKMFIEEKVEIGNIPEDLDRILRGYERKYKRDKLKYLGSEIEFTVPLIPGVAELTGRIDGVVEDKRKRKWLKETKSFSKDMPQEEVRLTDQQTVVYCWAIPQLGLPEPQGVMWDYVRSKPPTLPQQLKAGGLSKAKKIRTNYHTYLEEIKRLGLKKKDYADILDELKDRPDEWYHRIYLPARPHMIDILIKDWKEAAWEIYYLEGTSQSRSINWDCSRCDYYPICRAELQDLDTEYIIKKEYKERREESGKKKEEDYEED